MTKSPAVRGFFVKLKVTCKRLKTTTGAIVGVVGSVCCACAVRWGVVGDTDWP